MKVETKLKIIRWVKRLLNYEETNKPPFIIKETRQIQIVRAVQILPEIELKLIDEEQLKFAIGLELLSELQKTPAIKYTIEKDSNPDKVRHIAELKYILP